MGTTRRVVLGVLGGATVLAVGYAIWPGRRLDAYNALDAGKDERFLGNWIKIASDDTVTIVVPHCDMGTGIFTALPQMAAEELDSDWDKIKVEQAPSDPLFANGALAEGFILGQQGIAPDQIPAFLKATVANTFRTIASYMDLQVTGGSSAVRATGVYGMRVAAAAAREMLMKAAAKRWNVAVEDCSTKSNRVIHAASGRSFRYGELVEDAAGFTPSMDAPQKARSQYRIVGTSVPRIDIPTKVNGKTMYGIDVLQPGMLYAAIRISPVFGAKLQHVDESPLAGKRGIKKVVKLDDAVVVVADRFWRARDGVAALNPVFDDHENGRVTSALITARQQAAIKGELKSDLKTGNGADALAGARVIEATYQVPYLSHAPMEPMNATALFKDGTLEVWSGTQDGLGSRAWCAKTAGLPLEKVTFHLLHSGGAFGRRLPGQWNFLDYAVKTAMAMPGVPVKLLFTREQDMQHDYYRPTVMSRFKGGLDKNGALTAWVNDYTTEDTPNTEAHIPYAVPNQAISTGKVEAHHVPTAPWRSVEASWHGFFVESFMDELAHAAGKDPVDFRRALLKDKPRHLATLNLAAEKAGWGTPLPQGEARGIALVESFGSVVAEVAHVAVAQDGTVKVKRLVAAIGPGMAVNPDGLKAQIEGGMIFGLSAALFGEITIDKGAVVQQSFPDYEMVRLEQCPEIEVHVYEDDGPLGGAGEPGVPPVAPAVVNAIFAATGKRIRILPIKNHPLTAAARPTKAA